MLPASRAPDRGAASAERLDRVRAEGEGGPGAQARVQRPGRSASPRWCQLAADPGLRLPPDDRDRLGCCGRVAGLTLLAGPGPVERPGVGCRAPAAVLPQAVVGCPVRAERSDRQILAAPGTALAQQSGPAQSRALLAYDGHADAQAQTRCLRRAQPRLLKKDGKTWNPNHGSVGFACRIPTGTGTRLLKRFGYGSKAEAKAAAEHVAKLLALAPDDATRAKIGDLIMVAKRGTPLQSVEDVRRRLMLGQDPGSTGVTFGEAWSAWLSGNKRLRTSAHRRLEGIGQHWLLPALADVPLERLSGEHCIAVFDRIERINADIAAQHAAGQSLVKAEEDVRQRSVPVGVAGQHRVFAALRSVLNFEVKVTRRLAFNPVYAVRLEPEYTPEAESWSADQARRFLAHAAGDEELGLLFRVAVIGGARRGELVGLRWSGADLDTGYLRVTVPVLKLGGKLHEEERGAKTRAGRGRRIWLDAGTIGLLREHREKQYWERLTAGDDWTDKDLIFCKPDGTPHNPDRVYRRFRRLAAEAGVPVIKLHEGGRHTQASLANDAGIDAEIRRKTLGHSDAAMTSHYTHIQAEANRAAAEALAALVDGSES